MSSRSPVPEAGPWGGDHPVGSVVLITHDGAATIGAQIDAVLAQRWDRPWELVVLDNNSTQDIAAVVADHAGTRDSVRCVRATGGRSVAYARNAGVAAARGEVVTVIDDDDVVGDTWLAPLFDAALEHGYSTGRLDLRRLNPPEVARTRAALEGPGDFTFCGLPVTIGACTAYRRAWFLAVGGNDEQLPAAEDTDFALRLHERYGRAAVHCPDSTYHYRLRTDLRSLFRQGRTYGAAEVVVYDRWRHRGRPEARVGRRAAGEWARLLLMVPRLPFDRSRRVRWAFRTGLRAGRLRGSLRHRVWFP